MSETGMEVPTVNEVEIAELDWIGNRYVYIGSLGSPENCPEPSNSKSSVSDQLSENWCFITSWEEMILMQKAKRLNNRVYTRFILTFELPGNCKNRYKNVNALVLLHLSKRYFRY